MQISMSSLLVLVLAPALIITPQSSYTTSAERLDHWCGKLTDGTWGQCDEGRCCSIYNYCGDSIAYCGPGTCLRNCHFPTPPDAGDETGTVVVTAVHNHYLDDHYSLLIKPAAINASSSSSSSSSSSALLSCAASLSSQLPFTSLNKYPWAALRVAPQNPNITTNNCGRCLKVTNLGAGGVHHEMKVRVVHEDNSREGMELDLVTFNQLDTDGHGSITGRLLLKYEFEAC